MEKTRLRNAYLIAPIVPSVILLVGFRLFDVRVFKFMAFFSVPVSYIACLLFGMPLISLLKKKHKLNLLNLAVAGAVIGILVFYLFGIGFAAIMGSQVSFTPDAIQLLWGAGLGLSVAIPFGLIAKLPLFVQSRETKSH